MKNFIYELLSENGKISTTRLVVLLNSISSIVLAFYGLHKGIDPMTLSTLIGSIIVPSLGAKVIQKKSELANKGAENEVVK